MSEQCKPRLVVSRCLGFEPCRYNAQMITDDFLERLKPFVELTTVCPEADIGLGTPRDPVRLVQVDKKVRMLQPATGADVTDAMSAYIDSKIKAFAEVDGFLMKGRSPSCGPSVVKVYSSDQKGSAAVKGMGMFAHALAKQLPHAALEDEGRLKNFHIREAFLMRLFALARLRGLIASPSVNALSRFHAAHKLLLMCYHQDLMRQCGRIAANSDRLGLQELVEKYAGLFRETLMRTPSQRNIINALYHGYGWISEGLNAIEKKLFIDAVEEYRDDRVTLATLQHLLKSYVVRFDHAYLGSQVFLEPYPRALFDLSDSGH
ncbi:MAG: hypothetical protein AUJ57_11990 [Zetaproteobacteria bacterium CG1_02_53_45]|nr:MAG: hypothetical protein AUJ57_11990 [Zetaproteobacteria bacterium CG1_02_53_45]